MSTNVVEEGVHAIEAGLHTATDALRKTAEEVRRVADLAATELEETAKASVPSALFLSGGTFFLLCGATTVFVAAGLAATRGRSVGALLVGGGMLTIGSIALGFGLLAAPRHPLEGTRREVGRVLESAAQTVEPDA